MPSAKVWETHTHTHIVSTKPKFPKKLALSIELANGTDVESNH